MAYVIPTFDEYEEHCDDTWGGVPPGADILMYLSCAIAEEAGEILGNVKKAWRDDNYGDFDLSSGVTVPLTNARREAIIKEMGDQLYYMSRLAKCLSVTLQDVAEVNIDKLADRYQRGVIQGEGDER